MPNRSLTEQLMTLPLADRVHLAQELWESIGEALPSGDEREAIDQADRRDAELDSGGVRARTHEEVMEAVRRATGCDGFITRRPKRN